MIKRIILRLTVTAILVLALAVPAFAQGKPQDTPKGQVERGPEHARSICSYSGLNDHEEGDPPDQTQNYGHEKKSDPDAASPGVACSPNKGPSGPFPPHD